MSMSQRESWMALEPVMCGVDEVGWKKEREAGVKMAWQSVPRRGETARRSCLRIVSGQR
jgi:hypothetical protein